MMRREYFRRNEMSEWQRARLLARIDEPEKNWKFSEADVKERARWDDYPKRFPACVPKRRRHLGQTTMERAPRQVLTECCGN